MLLLRMTAVKQKVRFTGLTSDIHPFLFHPKFRKGVIPAFFRLFFAPWRLCARLLLFQYASIPALSVIPALSYYPHHGGGLLFHLQVVG